MCQDRLTFRLSSLAAGLTLFGVAIALLVDAGLGYRSEPWLSERMA
jgi:hypothetical protein